MRMEERDWMADWILERELDSDGILVVVGEIADVKFSSEIEVGAVVVSEVVSSNMVLVYDARDQESLGDI